MRGRLGAMVLVFAFLAGCSAPQEADEPGESSTATSDAPDGTATAASSSTSQGGTVTSSTSTTSSVSSTSAEPAGTSKDADQLVLLASDLGAGWSGGFPASGQENAAPNSTDYAEASVQRYSGTPRVVDTYVDVFASSAQALDYYNDVKADLQGHTLVAVQAGDEAFMWTDAPGYQEEGWVVKQNVVWYLYVAGEGGSMSPATDALLKKAAAKF